MSKIKEAIIEAIMPVIKSAGRIEMENVLSSIKEHNNNETYKNVLQGIYSNFSVLKEAALKTKTKIDEGIIDLVLEAVNEKADTDNIILAQ
jgi:hypothetical protein